MMDGETTFKIKNNSTMILITIIIIATVPMTDGETISTKNQITRQIPWELTIEQTLGECIAKTTATWKG